MSKSKDSIPSIFDYMQPSPIACCLEKPDEEVNSQNNFAAYESPMPN